MIMNQNWALNNPQLVFTYGYTASGKTTWCKTFLNWQKKATNKEWIYISADEVREELYGSQDKYGNPEEVYKVILNRMINAMKKDKNVLYDACNLRLDYRMDYLKWINCTDFEDYYKTIVRFNTDIDTCYQNHIKRGRNFSFNFDQANINQPPRLDEGWDNVKDLSNSKNNHSFYIASPFFEDIHRQRAYEVAEFLRKKGYTVFLPCEHKIPNAWDLPNYKWGEEVFFNDIKGIDFSDFLICLSYGRNGSAGTAWELGYAYGLGKKTIVVEMPETKLMSIMVSNGCLTVLKSLKELYNYNFDKFEVRMDKEMEQK